MKERLKTQPLMLRTIKSDSYEKLSFSFHNFATIFRIASVTFDLTS